MTIPNPSCDGPAPKALRQANAPGWRSAPARHAGHRRRPPPGVTTGLFSRGSGTPGQGSEATPAAPAPTSRHRTGTGKQKVHPLAFQQGDDAGTTAPHGHAKHFSLVERSMMHCYCLTAPPQAECAAPGEPPPQNTRHKMVFNSQAGNLKIVIPASTRNGDMRYFLFSTHLSSPFCTMPDINGPQRSAPPLKQGPATVACHSIVEARPLSRPHIWIMAALGALALHAWGLIGFNEIQRLHLAPEAASPMLLEIRLETLEPSPNTAAASLDLETAPAASSSTPETPSPPETMPPESRPAPPETPPSPPTRPTTPRQRPAPSKPRQAATTRHSAATVQEKTGLSDNAATASNAPEPARAASPLPPDVPVDLSAAYRHNPAPAYPPLARKKAWQGQVLLRARIAATGTVEQVEIAQSSGYRVLDEAARDSVAAWTFLPARHAGQAITANVEIPIVFRLQ